MTSDDSERHERAAHIAWRQDAVLVAQEPGRAAVVRHRDDRGKVDRMAFKGGKHGKAAGSAADGDDVSIA